MYYPKEVFNIREDITQKNMRRYDASQAKILAAILERYPNYNNMSLNERYAIREEIREIEKLFPWY